MYLAHRELESGVIIIIIMIVLVIILNIDCIVVLHREDAAFVMHAVCHLRMCCAYAWR